MNRFVFLDRDGTLVRDPGYVHRTQDYELLPGVTPGLRLLRDAGWKLAIVTNQSGIGRGMFTEHEFEAFQKHLTSDLAAQGIPIAGSFHCPHAPDEGCRCRKPAPGLFEQAHDALGADLSESWMIGDSARDAEAASAAGLRGSIWIGGPPENRPAKCEAAADFLEAVRGLPHGSPG
ncbi:MAG: HAD family hydrolase [bacterium]|nr:HAD family hydrolase [bacterium]MCP5070317.1 HAD family hydrolase [bacterium]